MKIATRLRLAALVPALMAGVIAVSLLVSYRVVWDAQETDRTVQRIIFGMNELSGFISQYVLFHENRPLEQFLIQHERIRESLSGLRLGRATQQQILEGIHRNLDLMKGSFLKLVENHDRYGSGQPPWLIEEVENRLAGRLLVWSRDVVSEASHLEQLIDEELTLTERRINALIFLLIISTTLFLTIGSIAMTRSITASLRTLREGTEKVGSGDFDHRIALTVRDEIGELSQSFDHMTERLQEVTVSKNLLEEQIEERRKAEHALREQREWLQVTLNSIGDAVMTTDARGDVGYLNPVALSLTGWTPEEARGRPARDVLKIRDERSGEPSEDLVNRVLEEARVVHMANHTELVRRDGSRVPIEDSAAPIRDEAGRVLGVVIVFHDVTEKRRAQEALRKSAETLRVVADFTYDWEHWRSPDNRFLYVSPSCERITGYTREALMEDPGLYTRIIHPEDCERVSRHMEEEQGDEVPHELEFRILHRDGRERWIGHVCQPVLDEKGRVLGRRASNRDITQRKRAEEALLDSRKELEERVQERTNELRERARQLARLSSQLTVAEQRERRRLAMIIHDHLQQLLVGAKMRWWSLSSASF